MGFLKGNYIRKFSLLPVGIGANRTLSQRVKTTINENHWLTTTASRQKHKMWTYQDSPPAANIILAGCITMAATDVATDVAANTPATTSMNVFPAMGRSGFPFADFWRSDVLPSVLVAVALHSEVEEDSNDSSSYPPIVCESLRLNDINTPPTTKQYRHRRSWSMSMFDVVCVCCLLFRVST